MIAALVVIAGIAGVSMTAVAQQAAGSGSHGGDGATPAQREFAEKFVKSVDARDAAQMRALIPPTTLKCFDTSRQKILDAWIQKQFKYPIPSQYQMSVSPLTPDMIKPSKVATY